MNSFRDSFRNFNAISIGNFQISKAISLGTHSFILAGGPPEVLAFFSVVPAGILSEISLKISPEISPMISLASLPKIPPKIVPWISFEILTGPFLIIVYKKNM